MKRKIVVSLLTSAQEFQQLQAEDAKATAMRVGIEVEILFAENNAIQQIHQLYQHIHAAEADRPMAILVEAVSRDGMERLSRNALRAGITWVAQQQASYLDRVRAETPGAAVHSVSVNDEEIGAIQALQAKVIRPQGGVALVIQGPVESDSASRRLRGLEQGLAGSGISMKAVLNGDWTAESATKAIASWLRLKSLDAEALDLVIAQNDSMAAGARAILQERRPDWARLPYTGCDGLPSGGRQMVERGQLAATVIKPTTTGPSVELVARRLNGEAVPSDLILQGTSYPPLAQLGTAARPRPADPSGRPGAGTSRPA